MLALICRANSARFVLSADVVNRILNAATWLPLEGLPDGVVGVLNVSGANLPVVDPRPRFAQPKAALSLEHHLIEIVYPRRFLLWVDAVEKSLELAVDQIQSIATTKGSVSNQLVYFSQAQQKSFGDDTLPALLPLVRPEAFDPGELLGR